MVVVTAAATGMLSLCGSQAFADSGTHGTAQGSPGLLSGNTGHVPVDIPVNVCGNSSDVSAALTPVFDNSCAHESGSKSDGGVGNGGSHGDSDTSGHRSGGRPGLPGGPSGDHTMPPAYGGGGHRSPPSYGGEYTPSPQPPGGGDRRPGQPPALAHTGGDARAMLAIVAVSAALIAGGAVLYRRGRAGSGR
ncbi:chaplin family protein [Streptomyces sp. NPDC007905]|uniref:chaplin n=1 Tax=Streptomyces sp. NPDC007905 TaxID=3364788 RepID=UPI0036EBD16D